MFYSLNTNHSPGAACQASRQKLRGKKLSHKPIVKICAATPQIDLLTTLGNKQIDAIRLQDASSQACTYDYPC